MNVKYFYLLSMSLSILPFSAKACMNSSGNDGMLIFEMSDSIKNDGKFTAAKKLVLTAGEEVGGSGYMRAPEIEITTKRFTFIGTINCSKKCIIKTQVPFDHTMFKREGSGDFIFITTEGSNQIGNHQVISPVINPNTTGDQLLEMAIRYRDGNGVESDSKKAIAYFTAAAEKGSPFALTQLGVYYIEGRGVEKNIEKGLAMVTQAVEKGELRAFFLLGNCYIEGKFVEKNDTKAFDIFKSGSYRGDVACILALAQCYLYGLGTNQDPDKALEYCQRLLSDDNLFNKLNPQQHDLRNEIAQKARAAFH